MGVKINALNGAGGLNWINLVEEKWKWGLSCKQGNKNSCPLRWRRFLD